MAITSYSTLQTEIANWLHRSDLTTYIQTFISLGEDRIYRELRVKTMETALSGAISAGVLALPSDYIELKYAYVVDTNSFILQRTTPDALYQRYPDRTAGGSPRFIAREGSNFIFGPYPDSTYTIKGIYYARLTKLSDVNTSNWFITDAPNLLLFAALAEAAPFLQNDERIPIWEAKYQDQKSQVQREDDNEALSGGALAMVQG